MKRDKENATKISLLLCGILAGTILESASKRQKLEPVKVVVHTPRGTVLKIFENIQPNHPVGNLQAELPGYTLHRGIYRFEPDDSLVRYARAGENPIQLIGINLARPSTVTVVIKSPTGNLLKVFENIQPNDPVGNLQAELPGYRLYRGIYQFQPDDSLVRYSIRGENPIQLIARSDPGMFIVRADIASLLNKKKHLKSPISVHNGMVDIIGEKSFKLWSTTRQDSRVYQPKLQWIRDEFVNKLWSNWPELKDEKDIQLFREHLKENLATFMNKLYQTNPVVYDNITKEQHKYADWYQVCQALVDAVLSS